MVLIFINKPLGLPKIINVILTVLVIGISFLFN